MIQKGDWVWIIRPTSAFYGCVFQVVQVMVLGVYVDGAGEGFRTAYFDAADYVKTADPYA